MQLNTWLPFFIQTPVFCEIFFKNISLSRPWGLLWNFSSSRGYTNDWTDVGIRHLLSLQSLAISNGWRIVVHRGFCTNLFIKVVQPRGEAHSSFKYSWFAITFFHAILFLLTEYDTLLHHIDCQFVNMEKRVTCFFYWKTEPFILESVHTIASMIMANKMNPENIISNLS